MDQPVQPPPQSQPVPPQPVLVPPQAPQPPIAPPIPQSPVANVPPPPLPAQVLSPQPESVPPQPPVAPVPPIHHDTHFIIVILLLVLAYPIGLVLMWMWMKHWPLWLKVVISIPILIGVVAIILPLFFLLIPGQNSVTYGLNAAGTPVPTVQNVRPEQKALNQANDSVRKNSIASVDTALKRYYTENKTAPTSLSELVTAQLIKEVPNDPDTQAGPRYTAQDPQHGCVASFTLTTGETVTANCK